nr:DUF1788 domain-containing protein [Moraxella sp.]
MPLDIYQRLNLILENITTNEFLSNQGLGNEIGFWIFDYKPSEELIVREYLDSLEKTFSKNYPDLSLLNINLFDSVVAYLEEKKLLDKSIQMQVTKGDDALFKALKAVLHMDKFVPFLLKQYDVNRSDIIVMRGIGSVFPLLRSHNLLNSLHAELGHKPLIMFYPGKYDGQTLQLFDKLSSNNYYRAFKLIPE